MFLNTVPELTAPKFSKLSRFIHSSKIQVLFWLTAPRGAALQSEEQLKECASPHSLKVRSQSRCTANLKTYSAELVIEWVSTHLECQNFQVGGNFTNKWTLPLSFCPEVGMHTGFVYPKADPFTGAPFKKKEYVLLKILPKCISCKCIDGPLPRCWQKPVQGRNLANFTVYLYNYMAS